MSDRKDLTEVLAVSICGHGGHIPKRDRSLPGSCSFHRGRAAAYVDALAVEGFTYTRTAPGTVVEVEVVPVVLVPEPGTVERGVRCEETGVVVCGPGWDFLASADPKNYPGYTLVTRVVGGWEPFNPTEINRDERES